MAHTLMFDLAGAAGLVVDFLAQLLQQLPDTGAVRLRTIHGGDLEMFEAGGLVAGDRDQMVSAGGSRD